MVSGGARSGFSILSPVFSVLSRAAFVAAAVLLPSSFAQAASASAGGLDAAVLSELNYVRAHPAEYARELRDAPSWAMEQEEPQAVDEAIDALERQAPLPPLRDDRRLDAAALVHVRTQGPRGDVGHGPTGNLGQRLRDNGVYAGMSAENISYGYDDARQVVRQLIIDSRVNGRGHRRNILSTAYSSVGVSCGPHRQWGEMCVMDFAGALMERGKAE